MSKQVSSGGRLALPSPPPPPTAEAATAVPDHQSLPVISEERRKKAAEEREGEEDETNEDEIGAGENGLKSPPSDGGPRWVQGSVINPEGFKLEGRHNTNTFMRQNKNSWSLFKCI